VSRFCASGDHAASLSQHSGALLHRLSRRHRSTGGRFADGLRRMARSVRRRSLAHLRPAQQRTAHRTHPRRPRARCRRRRHQHGLRAQLSAGVSRLDEVKE
jgi:hypothetical protein